MSRSPKISIVTPSYNQGAYIERTIDSVLSQEYPNLEYIIIDGGSTDNSIEIIKKHEKHLTYWVSEKDNGQSHAINKGLHKCSGDIFNWLNSDDYFEKDILTEVGNTFQRNSQTLMLSGKARKFSRYTERLIPEHNTPNLEQYIVRPPFFQPATFISMKAIEQMGRLNEKLHYCMDFEWYIRFLTLFGIKYITTSDKVLVNAEMHINSKTVSQLSKFEKERRALHVELMHQLSIKSDFQQKLSQTVDNKELLSPLAINTPIDISLLEKFLLNFYQNYLKDASASFRDQASYFNYFGLKKLASYAAFQAIVKNPFNFINYKYLLSILFK